MRVYLLFFLFFISSISLLGNGKVDSLQSLLNKDITDSTRLSIYFQLVHHYRGFEPSSAIFYGEKGLDLARKTKDIPNQVRVLNSLGIAYYGLGNYEKTLEYFLVVLELENEFSDNLGPLARAMNNVGIIYDEIGRLDKATYYYEESLKIKRSANDSLGISNTMSNLGLVYMKRKMPEKAVDYFRQCYTIDLSLNNKVGLYNSLHNIGLYHKDYGDKDSAVYYIERALLAVPKGKLNFDKTFIIKSLAESYLAINNLRNAENYFEKAIEVAREVEALSVIKESYRGLSEIYEHNGQFKKSLAAYKKFKLLTDSIYNQDLNTKLSQLEKNFEIKEKEKEIELLTNKAEITDLQLTRKEYSNYFLAILGIMLALVAFISYNRYQLKNKSHKLLEQKNQEISQQKLEIRENRDEIATQRDNILVQKDALEEASAEILKSIWYAQSIQQAILPDLNKIKSSFHEFFMIYMPKAIVSGDFYWFTTKKDKVFFALADCTGHGIPAAFMTVMANDLLNSIIIQQDHNDCATILNLLDEAVTNSLQYKENSSNDGLDISLLCFNLKTRQLIFAGAGMDLIIYQDHEWETYKGERFSIGGFKSKEQRQTENINIDLKEDTQMYMFTDGYTDQFGGKNDKKFMRKNLRLLLAEIKYLPLDRQKERIEKTILDWKGDTEQTDDITFAGLRI